MILKFYRDNQEVIDNKLFPLISGGSHIVGGRYKIMYQDWAWDLAIKMQEQNITGLLKRKPIYVNHTHDPNGNSNPWTEWNYARMEFMFVLFAKIILTKVYKRNHLNFHHPISSNKI